MAFQPERLVDTKLFKRLIQIGPPDVSPDYVKGLCEIASTRMAAVQGILPQFTLHDRVHLLRVTELMALVLGDTLDKLNSTEIALLILAAHFHDTGMVPEASEWEQMETSSEYQLFRDLWLADHPNFAEINERIKKGGSENVTKLNSQLGDLEFAMRGEYIRRTHAERSAAFVLSLRNDARLVASDIPICDELAKLCLSHVEDPSNLKGFEIDKTIGNQLVNMCYLAVILRLADILDFDRERTPDSLYRTIHFTSNVSLTEWEKHRGVRGWIITPELLRFEMEFEQPFYERAAREFLGLIDDELDAAREIVSWYPARAQHYTFSLPWRVDRSRVGPHNRAYVYHDLEFSLSRDEIVKLLMTANLYHSPSICVRELLQNSLDALRYRTALYRMSNATPEPGEVVLEHGLDDDGNEFVRCRDNGAGMDEEIILSFLTKVGRSFYRSPLFQRERQRFRAKSPSLDFDPCSQFGIGFMSCFMLGDQIRIETRRDYGIGKNNGDPLIVEINGMGSLLTLRPGSLDQVVGTTVTVTCRGRPEALVADADQVRLVATLKEYVCAVDYPVSGRCIVPEFEDSIRIEAGFRPPPTYLERAGVKQFIRLNQKIHESDEFGSIDGIMSQSFLVDQNRCFVLANTEAAWEEYDPNNPTGKVSQPVTGSGFRLRTGENRRLINPPHINRVLCADGIRVADDMSSPGVSVDRCELMDTRGSRKPLLSPARKAIGSGDRWNYLSQLRNRYHGMIWAELAGNIPERLTIQDWWKLVRIYSAPLFYVPTKVLWNHIQVPLGPADTPRYLHFSDIPPMSFEAVQSDSPSAGYQLVTTDGQIDIQARAMVLAFSELRRDKDGRLRMHIVSPAPTQEIPSFVSVGGPGGGFSGPPTAILSCMVAFGDELKDVLSASCGPTLLNTRHPLGCLPRMYDARTFALKNFIAGLSKLDIGAHPNTLTPSQLIARRSMGVAYGRIRWDRMSEAFRPPFKMLSEKQGLQELTDADFRAWAQTPIPAEYEPIDLFYPQSFRLA
jgi:hypothetical protein